MKISVISFTRAGALKNLELVRILQENNHQAASFSWHKYTGRKLIPFKSLKLLFHDLWDSQDVFVLLWDLEHAARAVVPCLLKRQSGPAVVVMDEAGRFVIPLAKGKLEGLDGWCSWFAQLADAAAVSTAPVAQEERFLVDGFARRNDLHIQDIFRIRTVAQKLAEGGPIGIYSDYPVEGVLPEGFVPVGAMMNNGHSQTQEVPEVGISITDDWEAPHFAKECRMYPRNLVLGLVCEKYTEEAVLEQFMIRTLAEKHLSRERLCSLFAPESLAEEPGVKELADRLDIPYFTYQNGQLPGRESREQLCESCAVLGSGQGKRLVGVRKAEGIWLSVYEKAAELSF